MYNGAGAGIGAIPSGGAALDSVIGNPNLSLYCSAGVLGITGNFSFIILVSSYSSNRVLIFGFSTSGFGVTPNLYSKPLGSTKRAALVSNPSFGFSIVGATGFSRIPVCLYFSYSSNKDILQFF
ncbi:MAG: hypothetical protein DDT23_01372 [candidate division WS2 bacterium]|nr:hypothetical protein [Candidatus Lithacetigena glycinireducens]